MSARHMTSLVSKLGFGWSSALSLSRVGANNENSGENSAGKSLDDKNWS